MSTASTHARPAGSASRLVSRIPTDDSLPRWRAWASTHPVGSSLLAGAVATQFATVFGIWFRGFGLPTLNWPAVNGMLIIPTASPGAQYVAGSSPTSSTASFSPCCSRALPSSGPAAQHPPGKSDKGNDYGTILAIISAAWWVPYVGFPHAGAGVFSTGFGWKLVFGIFLWHWIYGYFLGTVYCPLPKEPEVEAPSPAPGVQTTEIHRDQQAAPA